MAPSASLLRANLSNMFERFNEHVRRSLFFARYEASRSSSRSIATQHVLLGMLREADPAFNRLLEERGIDARELREELLGDRVALERVSTSPDLPLAEESKKALAFAVHEAESMGHANVDSEHLVLGLLRVEGSAAAGYLGSRGLDLFQLREEVERHSRELEAEASAQATPLIVEYSRDLTMIAAEGGFDPLIGREQEVERMVQILSRRTKNNPLLLGESGVGKTAIVEGLASRIVDGSVPMLLADRRILALDLSLLVAGTKYRGQFEERLKGLLKELQDHPEIIIFLDEIHSLIGTGSAEGSLDAANIIKPALSRGEITCIGATTVREYRKYVEKDRALSRRFQAVDIRQPTEDETITILEGIQSRYEEFHGVRYSDDAIKVAVTHAGRYITDRAFPDKAIDVIDVLGLVSHQVIADLGSALLAGDLAGALDQLDRAYSYGMDLKRFINELLSWFRGLIVCKVSSQPKLLLDLAEEELASMQEAAAGYTVQTLSAFFNLLMESLEKAGYSSQPRLALEMAFIRAVQVGEVVPVSDILTRLDDVLAGVPLVDLAVVAPKPATMQQKNLVSQPAPIKEKQTEPVIATQESDVVQTVNKAESDPSPESIEPPTPSLEKEKPVEPDKEKPEDGKQAARKKDVRKHWNEFLQYVRDRKPWMTAALQRSASASLEQGQLIVHFDDAADCMMLKSKDNITLLTEFALDFFQENLRVKFHVPDSNACEISPGNGMDPQQERKALANDPLVLTALEIFNGQVGNIRVGPRFRKSLDSDTPGSKTEPVAD